MPALTRQTGTPDAARATGVASAAGAARATRVTGAARGAGFGAGPERRKSGAGFWIVGFAFAVAMAFSTCLRRCTCCTRPAISSARCW